MKKATFQKSMTVAISQKVYEAIKEITDKNQISMGSWIRATLDQALAEYSTKGGDKRHDRK